MMRRSKSYGAEMEVHIYEVNVINELKDLDCDYFVKPVLPSQKRHNVFSLEIVCMLLKPNRDKRKRLKDHQNIMPREACIGLLVFAIAFHLLNFTKSFRTETFFAFS